MWPNQLWGRDLLRHSPSQFSFSMRSIAAGCVRSFIFTHCHLRNCEHCDLRISLRIPRAIGERGFALRRAD